MTQSPRTKLLVELGPVQETLLIPLLGRARETAKSRGLIGDPKAVEIVDSLDYDFSKWEGGPSLVGSCLRTRMFDRYVEDFLTDHPSGTVVELGCGLNSRFERLDNGQAQWFDLDLPDVMALRRRFFEDGPRRTMLTGSILELEWMDRVVATGGPWIVVAEAVLIYLGADDARWVIETVTRKLPGALIAFDTTSQRMVAEQGKHDAMRHLPQASWFRWACDDPREVESWNGSFRLLASRSFLDADDDLVARFPLAWRLLTRYAPWVLRPRIGNYRLNLVATQVLPRGRAA